MRNVLKEKQAQEKNKVMLFSTFRHTLHYLFGKLKDDGFRVGLIHGDIPDDERLLLRERFEKPKEAADCLDVLLFSEVGCEGLDYQFCDCMVNYDLPWNPMRIEQRIGRIDRKGQESEKVSIINMVTPGTVDAEIYERCLMRIGIFERELGAGEEILGNISQEITKIAENQKLTAEERAKKLQQLADNNIRLVQEQEQLEQKQAEFFGIRLPQEQMQKDIASAESYWLSPDSLYRVVDLYLKNLSGKEQEVILGEKSLKTLRLSQDVRNSLLEDFRKLPKHTTATHRQWELWLKGENQHLAITFDAACAAKHNDAAFIMPLHPLVKQAALFFDNRQSIMANLKVISDVVPTGEYAFAIYQWRVYGVRDDLVLQPISTSADLTPHLHKLLEKAVDNTQGQSVTIEIATKDVLDAQHYDLWSKAKDNHIQRTSEIIKYREESLSTSHKARIALLEEQYEQATEEKIRRMRKAQMEAAEADFARRKQELKMALEKVDIIGSPVAYGVLKVTREV